MFRQLTEMLPISLSQPGSKSLDGQRNTQKQRALLVGDQGRPRIDERVSVVRQRDLDYLSHSNWRRAETPVGDIEVAVGSERHGGR